MAKLVNWYKFNKIMKDKKILLFSTTDIQRIFSVSKVAANFLLFRYAKKGYIARIKRGIYGFPDALPPELFLANKIYEPSYVSLEFALSYHRIIPENVYEITSITTKATRRFETLGKVFSYRKVKKGVFTGYTIEKQNDVSFRIADAEKALVDYSYFRLLDGNQPLSRFDKTKIDFKKALHYAKAFNNQKLTDTIQTILK